ncbi:hypothetical protein RI367_007031 [Sorochytrium milnesiophthora]
MSIATRALLRLAPTTTRRTFASGGGPAGAMREDAAHTSAARFFSVDPELFPLFGLVTAVVFGGSFLLGRKWAEGGATADAVTSATQGPHNAQGTLHTQRSMSPGQIAQAQDQETSVHAPAVSGKTVSVPSGTVSSGSSLKASA